MRRTLVVYWLILLSWPAYAQTGHQTGTGLDCANAFYSTDNLFCSENAQYNNQNIVQNGVTWFRFKAILPVVTATISGNGPGGTLLNPQAAFYSDCGITSIPSISSITGGVRTVHADGLTIGNDYYVRVTGSNTGTFKFCINNYEPTSLNGPDCETAQFIYSTNDIKIGGNAGVGANGHEADGTCLNNAEANTTWFKWQAANNDPLVFTLIPDIQTNDLNFVLYDFGLSSSCANISESNARRCAAGSGVSCRPPDPRYFKTGLSVNAADLNEGPGCGPDKDGIVQSVDMVAGHFYGLLVDNASAGKGYTLKFNDALTTAPSTVKFAGPTVDINITPNSCQADRTYIFYSYLTVTNEFTWDFGPGATILNADALDKFTVIYDSPGKRTVKLILIGSGESATQDIDVPASTLPVTPTAAVNKAQYCTGDTILLSTPQIGTYTYTWTTPEGFNAQGANIYVPITDKYKPGTAYTVTASNITSNNTFCAGGSATVIPNVSAAPVAAFTTVPQPNTTLEVPSSITFTNTSVDANSYLWDFGDAAVSTEMTPTHKYTTGGKYHIKLTAFNTNGCSSSVTTGDFILKYSNTILLFNSFTPNADNINDKFVASITNISTFHIQVFNRYGKKVFETRDQSINWDGTSNGSAAPVGTYYYIIDAIGLDGNKISESGYVTLLR